MKANDASGITKDKNSVEAVVTTGEKTESVRNAKKTTQKTSKKSTVKPIDKIVEKPVEKEKAQPKEVLSDSKTEKKNAVRKSKTANPKKVSLATDTVKVKEKKVTKPKKTLKKEFYFQYLGNQIDEDTLLDKVMSDCKGQNVVVKEIKLYLKPEDNTCYYVANGNVAGKVEIY